MAKKDKLTYDFTRMMADSAGAANGVTQAEFKAFGKRAAATVKEVAKQRQAGKLPYMDLPYQAKTVKDIIAYAAKCAGKYENLVVLGIGGSALGMISLQSALNPSYYNLMSPKQRGGRPRLFVEDNVEPDRIADMLEVINPKKTLFNVVTKSGGTAETMSAFMIARDLIAKKVGASKLSEHMVATTDISKGNLRVIADKEKLTSFIVPDGVGGRFSVLSPVGLLPAALVGIDIRALLKGAAGMDAICRSESLMANPALAAASLQYICCTKKGKAMQVMMPYSNRLRDVADWYRQLWAESLGKNVDLAGKAVNAGQTPIKALGATDQHSQVQLYNEGPNDKTFTLIRTETFGKDITIPKVYQDISGISYLGGHTMGELLNAECLATEKALTDHKRPNSCIILPAVNETTVGALLYMLEVETSYAGVFFNINTYDQPGVEAGKIATYALMGRPGYEKQAEEIRKASSKLKKMII